MDSPWSGAGDRMRRSRPRSVALVSSIAALLMAGGSDARDLYPGRGFPTSDLPVRLAVADLDGDGLPDLVTGDANGDDVSVVRGNGDGTFQPPVSFPGGAGPVSVAVADLDGDRLPDLVTANSEGGDVSVLLGNADGSF